MFIELLAKSRVLNRMRGYFKAYAVAMVLRLTVDSRPTNCSSNHFSARFPLFAPALHVSSLLLTQDAQCARYNASTSVIVLHKAPHDSPHYTKRGHNGATCWDRTLNIACRIFRTVLRLWKKIPNASTILMTFEAQVATHSYLSGRSQVPLPRRASLEFYNFCVVF